MSVVTPTRACRAATAICLAALVAACSSPVTPTPPVQPPPPPPPNTPPAITSLTASLATLETTEAVQLVAEVTDAESTTAQLTLQWSAPGGTFTGEGLSVSWQASPGLVTPADVALTLTVVERYQGLNAQGQVATLEHRAIRSVTVRVHDSVKEIGDMGVSFLQKFATSSVSPDACLVDFSDNCRGKASEREDIERNRENFLILDSTLGTPRVTNLTKYSRADIRIACAFESRRLKCSPGDSDCVVGGVEEANGTCRLTAVYEQARWWLCSSNFDPASTLSPAMRLFFGE
jgi:hypothetical protein